MQNFDEIIFLMNKAHDILTNKTLMLNVGLVGYIHLEERRGENFDKSLAIHPFYQTFPLSNFVLYSNSNCKHQF